MDRHHTESENKSTVERGRKRLVAAGLAIGIGVTALAGCGPAGAQEQPKPTATQSVEVTPTVEPTPIETENPHVDLTPLMDLEMPESLQPYKDMSAEEFLKLPNVEDRLSYISWETRDEEEVADIWYTASGLPQDKYPGKITPDSSNQDITTHADYKYRAPFMSHFNRAEEQNRWSVVYDEATALKVMSATFLDPSADAFQEWEQAVHDAYNGDAVIGTAAQLQAAGALVGNIAEAATEENVPLTIGDKEYISRTIPTRLSSGKRIEVTYVYVEFTNYAGEPEGTFVEASRKILSE